MRITACCCLIIFLLALWPTESRSAEALPGDSSSAVILAYHRIGEDAYPENNLRSEQFLAHLDELTNGGYTVLPLPQIIKALKQGNPLPHRTIAITFEGGYQSAYDNAIAHLIERKIPFTVFFASGQADSNARQHMNWEELRSLAKHDFVTLGILPASYTHLVRQTREEILGEINRARLRYRQELGQEPQFFSYPFGEYSADFSTIIREQNFEAAFGLQSGSASALSDFTNLPRFSMTESYGDVERFRLVASALPLPAEDIQPANPEIDTQTPVIGFSVPQLLSPELKNMSCFVSGQGQPGIEILGERRIQLRLQEPLSDERTRINCTMPGPKSEGDETQSWRWFGMLLLGNPEEADESNPPQDELR